MGTKVTLTNLTKLDSTSVNDVNSNFDDIETEFDKCLYRDGTSPNQMTAEIDMNSNAINNVSGITFSGGTLNMNNRSITNVGSFDMDGNKITSLGQPTADDDAARLVDVGVNPQLASATNITISDTNGKYTGTNVDDALDEIAHINDLTEAEVDQIENIDSVTISNTQWGHVGALDQGLATTDAVTFATVDTGQGANELYAMDQDVQTSDSPEFVDVVLNPEHATDGGTDAYVSATTTSQPGTGKTIVRDFQSANTTTTPTLDGVTIKTRDGSALWAGAIDGTHSLYDDGTDYLLRDPVWVPAQAEAYSQTEVDTFTRGYIDGCEISNGTDSDHDIDIAAGVVSMRDGSGNRKLFSVSAITKQIDVDWSSGDDAGGFPSGLTLSSDTWYHVFLIGKNDGTVDAGFDTDTSASNLLGDASSYSWFKHIAWILTDGSSNITPTLQDGKDFTWDVPVLDDDNNNPGTSAVTVTVTAPPDDECQVIVNGGVRTSTGANQAGGYNFIISALAQTDTAPSASNHDSGSGRANAAGERELSVIRKVVRLNASSQIRYRVDNSDANMTFKLNTIGWRDLRRGE